MSSNDEMYSILTPCLSLSPTPTPFLGDFVFPFFSLRASCLSKVTLGYIFFIFFFLPTRF